MPLVIPARGPDLGWMESLCDAFGDERFRTPLELPAWGTIEPHVLAVSPRLGLVHRGLMPGLVRRPPPLDVAELARAAFFAPGTMRLWRTFTLRELQRACSLPAAARTTCSSCGGTGLHRGPLPDTVARLVTAGETDPTEPLRTWAPVIARVLGQACPLCGGHASTEVRGDGYRTVAGVVCDARDLALVVDHVSDYGAVVHVGVDADQVCAGTADWRVRLAPIESDLTAPELGAIT